MIATASVGAGHNSAARAIADRLRAAEPDWRVDVTDVLTFAPWAFRAYYAGGYSLAVSKLPWLYGLGYWLKDRPQGPKRGLTERYRLWNERHYLRRFARHAEAAAPDLVVHTHFLVPPLLARLARLGRLDAPQFVVVTDVRVHRFWFCEGMDQWFAPAEPTAEHLRTWGIAPGRITVSGMPIHPKWTVPLDRRKVLADWHLPDDRAIVLLSGGTEFTCGPVVEIARRIAAGPRRPLVAVLAGRNKKLLGKLASLPESGRDVVSFGYTDRAHELVEVCSLMVTKAGGLVTAECAAKGKPMVLLKPVPGQESGNAAYFAREGAAVVTGSAADAVGQVRRLLGASETLRGMADHARRLHRPAADTIVRAIRSAVRAGTGSADGAGGPTASSS